MKLVIDASVAIKWIVRDPSIEPNADRAIAILRKIRDGIIEPLAPPHFMTEVLAVIARERAQRVQVTFGILRSMPLTIVSSDSAYLRATELAIRLNHHMFDTFYHAVALEVGATLVTADERYFNKANQLGNIVLLGDFALPAAA